MSVDISAYPFKSQLDPSVSIGEKMFPGDSYKGIYNACISGECKYVAKILPAENIHDFGDTEDYTFRDLAKNELIITKYMSEIGVGPIVHDMALTDTQAILILDKYDIDLLDLFMRYQYDKTIPMDKIMNTLGVLVYTMHKSGVVHCDLLLPNVFYREVDEKITIIDYGKSTFSDSKIVREFDMKGLNAMFDVYYRIRNGEIIGEVNDFLDAVTLGGGYMNGKKYQ